MSDRISGKSFLNPVTHFFSALEKFDENCHVIATSR